MAAPTQDEQRIALFIDFENIAIGVRDAHYRKFDINLVLERLLDKGKLLVKKAYADWTRYSDYKRSFHEAAIELIEVPQKSVGGKNSADIRLVVDAMDLAFQKEHINCFVVASGDSDFSPLVSKLKENDKHVIGLGVKNSTSDLLTENCDEFIFYEDLVRARQRPMPQIGGLPEKIQECFSLLVDSVLALQRENKESLWGSMVKETMKRKRPSFNETYYGYRTFSHLLEDAQRKGIVTLRRDQRSGSYVVEDLGAGAVVGGAAAPDRPAASAPSREARGTHTPPPSSVPTVPTPSEADAAADEAEAAESGERSERSPRRRRGRGRRGRSGTTADTVLPGSESEDGADADEAETAEDEQAATGEPSSAAPEAPAEATPEPPLRAEEPARTERGLFSLFSWARREPAAPDEGGKKDD